MTSTATATRGKPGRKTAAHTEAKILDVATDLFAKIGYDAASIRMIADAAGITIPTIYLYYKNKRALYLACCLHVFKRGSDTMGREMERADTPEERVYRQILALCTILLTDPHLAKLFQRELLESDTEGLELLDRDAFQESLGRIEDEIRQALGGAMPPLAGVSIFALTFGFIQYLQVGHVLSHEFLPLERRPELLARHVLRLTLPEIHRRLFG